MRGRRGSSHYDSDLEEMVRDRLMALGYVVGTQVRRSGIDLAVVHPNDEPGTFWGWSATAPPTTRPGASGNGT
ncbi:MAG: hypothetical protein J4G04_08560 [Nitrosopumilaceae archaeon]|nr:hypothetical protein [Nitrosopumilaceae archaeon]